jgi:membrane associated rhomboid family serine protease
MIPIGDLNPSRRTPYITYALIIINVLVFLYEQTLDQEALNRFFQRNTVVPLLITDNIFSLETLLDSVRSMFFHGSWLHLGGNMLYLWVFGDNIEDRLGRFLYLPFYLFCGFVAVFGQVIIEPDSAVPLVGASGAIAGVLGAYIVLYPRAYVRTLIMFFFITIRLIPAVWVLGFWFALQLFNGISSLGVETAGGGVAFFAHIGGFVAGAALMFIHRGIFGAPRIMTTQLIHQERNWERIREARRPLSEAEINRAHVDRRIPPIDLDPVERVTRQVENHRQLTKLNPDDLTWMLTDGRAYMGRILRLDDESVMIRESDGGVFVLPLENIIKLG